MNRKIISTTLRVAITAISAIAVLGLASCEIDWAGRRDKLSTGMVDAPLARCNANTDCPGGYCNTAASTCVTSVSCSAELPPCATASECDARGVCVPKTECHGDADCASGTRCQGDSGSATAGQCVPDASGCGAIVSEAACVADEVCVGLYFGTGCTNAAGTACDVADSGCHCAEYTYDGCVERE